jgi:hypothetical protein
MSTDQGGPDEFRLGRQQEGRGLATSCGAGQGVGQVFDAPPAAEIAARLVAEYEAARAALDAGETILTQLKHATDRDASSNHLPAAERGRKQLY